MGAFKMKQSAKAMARLFFTACFCCVLAFYAGLGRAEDVKAAAKPISDKRGTVDYRTKIAGVLARRAATIAYQRAENA